MQRQMGRYQCGSCDVPQHKETVSAPHYAYTMNKQTHTDNWLAHQMQYRTVPVTQEVHYVEHPASSACLRSPPSPCRRAPPATCTPPLHSETVRVPHHIYTQHTQPTVRRWMSRNTGCTQHPVTQETRQQAHDVLDSCPPGSGGF